MGHILAWIKSWFGYSHVSRQVDALRRRVEFLHQQKAISDRRIEEHLEQLAVIRSQFTKRMENAEADLEGAKLINKKLDATLATTLESLEAKEKIVIPGLVAANQTLISRWHAETSVLELRKLHANAERTG